MIRVFSTPVSPIAHIVKGALEAEGIPAEVRNEGQMQLAGGLPVDQCLAEVWVEEHAARRAARVVESLLSTNQDGALSVVVDGPEGRLSSAPEWSCRDCGEGNPVGFELCWSCQRERI